MLLSAPTPSAAMLPSAPKPLSAMASATTHAVPIPSVPSPSPPTPSEPTMSNERGSERTNERRNERVNDPTNDRVNERTTERMTKTMPSAPMLPSAPTPSAAMPPSAPTSKPPYALCHQRHLLRLMLCPYLPFRLPLHQRHLNRLCRLHRCCTNATCSNAVVCTKCRHLRTNVMTS
jgi:hypothetical protein